MLNMRRLFQQFCVDMYCEIETERLNWVRREQSKLRADSYSNLRDSLSPRDGDPQNVGQVVVLPATVTGSPRYMHGVQCDGMAYIRRYGKPDFFVTITTNPKWKEIRENLHAGQEAHDRPDIIVRVFSSKIESTDESNTRRRVWENSSIPVYNRVSKTWLTSCTHSSLGNI